MLSLRVNSMSFGRYLNFRQTKKHVVVECIFGLPPNQKGKPNCRCPPTPKSILFYYLRIKNKWMSNAFSPERSLDFIPGQSEGKHPKNTYATHSTLTE
jgi:hypothetical protein